MFLYWLNLIRLHYIHRKLIHSQNHHVCCCSFLHQVIALNTHVWACYRKLPASISSSRLNPCMVAQYASQGWLSRTGSTVHAVRQVGDVGNMVDGSCRAASRRCREPCWWFILISKFPRALSVAEQWAWVGHGETIDESAVLSLAFRRDRPPLSGNSPVAAHR